MKKKVPNAQYIPRTRFSFFPCLSTTANPTWFSFKPSGVQLAFAIKQNASSHLCVPVLSEFSFGAERWALMQRAVNLCKCPVRVSNCLFWLKKEKKSVEPTDVWCWQMDSERFPSEDSLSSDLFKYTFEVSFSFTVSMSGPSIWQCVKLDFQSHYAVQKFPPDRTFSPRAPYAEVFERSAELVFLQSAWDLASVTAL